MKRILFIMIDGLGDLNSPLRESIENTTVDFFSVLNTPIINEYFIGSKNGYFGLVDPVEPGIACGSDTAHLSQFGLKPIE